MMKVGRWLFVVVFLGIGCFKYEYSDVLTENVVVVECVYTPSRHSSGSYIGTDFEGNLMTGITSSHIPEKYAVVFKCQHGKFIVEDEELWRKISEGESVEVLYREKYCIRGDEKSLVDYDFLNVVKDGEKVLDKDRYDK